MNSLDKWMRVCAVVLVICQANVWVNPASADPFNPGLNQVWTWKLTGPYGGDARTIAIDPTDPQRIYVGTNDGQVFHSQDGGRFWQVLLSFNQPGFCIGELLIDAEDSRVIYVAGWTLISESGGGIFRSRDRGQTWETLPGMLHHSVRALAQAPGNRNVLVAGALEGVFLSRDRGERWVRISPEGHPEIRNVESLAIDPRSEQVIYVGTWHLPWKTIDGGRTWFRTGSRETGMIDDSDVFSIVVDQANPDIVLLSACTGIYKSTNGGRSWSRMNAVPSRSRRTLVLWKEPSEVRVIYAGTTEGLWKTADGGATWRLITSVKLVVQDIAVSPTNRDRVYLATENSGILVSSNGGQSFESANQGFSNRIVSVVVPDKKIKGRMYCGVIRSGNGGSFFVSDDAGMSWRDSSQNLTATDVRAIHQSESDPSLLYVLTNRGVFRSSDRGGNWKRIPPIEAEGREQGAGSEEQGDTDQSLIQIGLFGHGQVPHQSGVGQGGMVALRRDGLFIMSESEQEQGAGGSRAAARAPGRGRATVWRQALGLTADRRGSSLLVSKRNVIFVGTTRCLLVSRDLGKSWSEIAIPSGVGAVQAIAEHPSDESLIFVGTPMGLFRSRNGGRTWERCNHGLPMADFVSITIRSESPDEMTVCDYKRGAVYYSSDRGERWERIDHVTAKSRAWMATFDPFDGNRLLVAASGAGVYVGVRRSREPGAGSREK